MFFTSSFTQEQLAKMKESALAFCKSSGTYKNVQDVTFLEKSGRQHCGQKMGLFEVHTPNHSCCCQVHELPIETKAMLVAVCACSNCTYAELDDRRVTIA